MCDEYLKTSRRTITVFFSFCQYCRGVCFFNRLIIVKCRFHYMDLVPVFDCIVVSILLFFSVLIIRSCLSNSGRLLLIQSLFCLSFLITSRSILTAAPSKNTHTHRPTTSFTIGRTCISLISCWDKATLQVYDYQGQCTRSKISKFSRISIDIFEKLRNEMI